MRPALFRLDPGGIARCPTFYCALVCALAAFGLPGELHAQETFGAAPQRLFAKGGGVTLWDEIGPPSPVPVPVDAAQAAQAARAAPTSVASYQAK
ncbi:hypothetical protein VOM14_06715 [Paraburkholderia sp. MPAMCS5]|uniref:hypothetical protein n=1 Tax=Paraburkholderia sp. MPAMCS5 TaxID=3112563 RepID=UPI002E18155A|nr:hypothetical protein [Paraburkholderia sp. MPAMCS5]